MTEPSTLEILVAARALIEQPENWIQRIPTATRDGWPVGPGDRDAARFCAMGAITRAGLYCAHCAGASLELALPPGAPASVAAFNDLSTHADVLALFDRAIALERAATGASDPLTAQVQAIIDEALAGAAHELAPVRPPS